jgi:hypothetical protein
MNSDQDEYYIKVIALDRIYTLITGTFFKFF